MWSDLEVADVPKEEDTRITHQEAGVRDIAQNREKQEWTEEENKPNTDWQCSTVFIIIIISITAIDPLFFVFRK